MRIKRYCMVCLSLILVVVLSIFPVFASVYELDPDTEVLDRPQIYYTDNYYPGMFADGRSTFAVSSYGSYSAYNWNPVLFYQYGSSSSPQSGFKSFSTIDPTVNVTNKQVSAEYVASVSTSLLSANVILNLDNTYLDFQSSDFTFNQESAQADTFLLNGTFRFSLTSFWEFFVSSTTSLYAAVDPVAVQFLVDGKPYGPVMELTSYASPYTAAFSNTSPVSAVVNFDNVKIYGVTSTPELIGFRVYVDSNYDGGMYNLSISAQNSGVIVTNTNIVSWTSQPTIEFVRESTSSDADLSNLGQLLQNGLFNGNGVPFLDIVNSFLQDGLFDSNGNSFLSYIYDKLTDDNGGDWLGNIFNYGLSLNSGSYLYQSGDIANVPTSLRLPYLLSQGFLGLRSLMVDSSGTPFLSTIASRLTLPSNNTYLGESGTILTSGSVLNLTYVLTQGVKGLSSNIKSLRSYFADGSFTWQNYNLDTHELDSAVTFTGQNQLFQTAFQSIEENLGRLTYVFASDDELELRDEADPGVSSFKDAFGGGAKAKDIGQMKNTFDDVETMFDTGFSINDFFGSLNSDSSWLSWFSAETAYALDSTPAVMTVSDDDPYNHQAYQNHLAAVEAIRNRGGAD